eukprot:370841-Pelagomonas_calceolata.AAC.4
MAYNCAHTQGRRRLNNNENSDDKVDGDQGAVQAAGPDTDLDEDNDGDRDADNSISRFNSQIPELGKKRKASLMGELMDELSLMGELMVSQA